MDRVTMRMIRINESHLAARQLTQGSPLTAHGFRAHANTELATGVHAGRKRRAHDYQRYANECRARALPGDQGTATDTPPERMLPVPCRAFGCKLACKIVIKELVASLETERHQGARCFPEKIAGWHRSPIKGICWAHDAGTSCSSRLGEVRRSRGITRCRHDGIG